MDSKGSEVFLKREEISGKLELQELKQDSVKRKAKKCSQLEESTHESPKLPQSDASKLHVLVSSQNFEFVDPELGKLSSYIHGATVGFCNHENIAKNVLEATKFVFIFIDIEKQLEDLNFQLFSIKKQAKYQPTQVIALMHPKIEKSAVSLKDSYIDEAYEAENISQSFVLSKLDNFMKESCSTLYDLSESSKDFASVSALSEYDSNDTFLSNSQKFEESQKYQLNMRNNRSTYNNSLGEKPYNTKQYRSLPSYNTNDLPSEEVFSGKTPKPFTVPPASDFQNTQEMFSHIYADVYKTHTMAIGNLKHCNKERHRRERIKLSCSILRSLLPISTQNSIKLDMATVLEVICQYLHYLQKGTQPETLNELNEAFTNMILSVKRKSNQESDKFKEDSQPSFQGKANNSNVQVMNSNFLNISSPNNSNMASINSSSGPMFFNPAEYLANADNNFSLPALWISNSQSMNLHGTSPRMGNCASTPNPLSMGMNGACDQRAFDIAKMSGNLESFPENSDSGFIHM